MKNILILEDEEVIGKIYEKALLKLGYNAKWYKTTADAEKAANKDKYDLFILDHGLVNDDRSGVELIPVLQKTNPKAKVLMLTNYSDFQVEKKARAAGAHDYLLKIDTTPNVLAEYVKKLFRKS
ncbi:response regulator [Candidatus Peregrinibacteria bacterium]|nr:response regulator [Candidatus Peregrinibacteria bacterium]